MAKQEDKHQVAKMAEEYGDYIAVFIGALGFMSVIGAIGNVTLFPDAGSSGLFALGGAFATLGGTTLLWGEILASGSALYAAGTNQAKDVFLNKDEKLKTVEGVAFLIAFLIPLAFGHITEFANIVAGNVMAQSTFLGIFLGAMAKLGLE